MKFVNEEYKKHDEHLESLKDSQYICRVLKKLKY